MNTMLQGLQISALGLALTFTSLGLFILVIMLIDRLFPAAPETAEEAPPAEEAAPEAAGGDEEGAQIAAAIAAALAFARAAQEGHGGLGSALEAGRGRWWEPGYMASASGIPHNGHGNAGGQR